MSGQYVGIDLHRRRSVVVHKNDAGEVLAVRKIDNLVERWFAELTQKWLKRGTHHSTRQLVASIRTWIQQWNDEPKPFVWHKTADEILDNLANYCTRISDSGH